MAKVESAGAAVAQMNPDVKLVGVDPKGSRYQAEFLGGGASAARPASCPRMSPTRGC